MNLVFSLFSGKQNRNASITAVGVSVGSVIGFVRMYYWYQDRKPTFIYESVKEEENWHRMILHPDKPIHKIPKN